MSFSNHARMVRDATLPYPRRLSSLRSCVEQYRPIGYHATLSYLEAVAGPFQRDEEALLRALDVLGASRLLRNRAHQEYAARRREEKRAGQRVPRNGDPDPATLDIWFGDAQGAALHALRYRMRAPRGDEPPVIEALRVSPVSGAGALADLTEACLAADGGLSPEQRQSVAALVAGLRSRTSWQAYERDPQEHMAARALLNIARLVEVASVPRS